MKLTLQLFHRQHCDNVWDELGRVWAWPSTWITLWIAQWHYLWRITIHRLPDSRVVYPACSSFLSERDGHAVSQLWSELACASNTATVQALTESDDWVRGSCFCSSPWESTGQSLESVGWVRGSWFLPIAMGKCWAGFRVYWGKKKKKKKKKKKINKVNW